MVIATRRLSLVRFPLSTPTLTMATGVPPLLVPVGEKTPKKRRLGLGVLYFFLPVGVFVFTSLPVVNRLTPILALVLVGLLFVLKFLPWKMNRTTVVLLGVLAVLALVGGSGWFFSPFFFLLYLAAVALGFVYTPSIAIAFTLGLIAIFASSIGEVSPAADFLTLLSLLAVIPIVIVLRRAFLLVQQERKGILILESDERRGDDLSALDVVLSNHINRISVVMRQPITYIRQGLALLKENALTPEEYPQVIERMSRSADEVFTLVKEFESETTKNTLVSRQRAGAKKTAPNE